MDTGSETVNTTVPKTYTIKYKATDSAGNISRATRMITVEDKSPPVITLNGNSSVSIPQNGMWSDPGAKVTDNKDTMTPADVVIGGDTIDFSKIGKYKITYDATDSAGNRATQVERIVNIVDKTGPVISLLGSASVEINKDEIYTDAGVTVTDNNDAPPPSAIVSGWGPAFDTSTAGIFTINYDATDSAGNTATQITRTVTVKDPSSTTGGTTTEELPREELVEEELPREELLREELVDLQIIELIKKQCFQKYTIYLCIKNSTINKILFKII